MTRITFDLLLFFVGGGIISLVSGESTVSAIAEQTVPSTKENILLPVAEASSPTVDDSSISDFSLNDDLSRSEDNESKSNISSFKGNELSNNSKLYTFQDKDNVSSALASNETTDDGNSKAELQKGEHKMKLKTVEGIISSSNDIADTHLYGSDKSSIKSDTYLSSSEANTAIVSSADTKEDQTDQNTTDISNDKLHEAPRPTKKRNTEKFIPKEEPDIPERGSAEQKGLTMDSINSNTETPEASSLVDSSQNSETPEQNASFSSKGATKKRSLNSTITTPISHEITTTLDHLSSPLPHDDLSFIDGNVMNNSISVIDHEPYALPSISNETVVVGNSFFSTNSSLGLSDKIETDFKHDMNVTSVPISNPHFAELERDDVEIKTSDSTELNDELEGQESKLPSSEKLKYSDPQISPTLNDSESIAHSRISTMKSDYAELGSSAVPNNITPTTLDDTVHMSKVKYAENSGHGVTFDPDGMIHDGPQDPDSIIFSVFTKDSEVTTSSIIKHSTETRVVYEPTDKPLQSAAERGGIERESNPDEPTANRTHEFESMGYPKNETEREPLSFQQSHVSNDNVVTHMNSTMDSISFINQSGAVSHENSSVITDNSATPLSNQKYPESNDDYEMLQDSPHIIDQGHNQSNATKMIVNYEVAAEQNKDDNASNSEGNSHDNAPQPPSYSRLEDTELVTETMMVETSSSFVAHETEQSVIRPVKIKIASPSDMSASTPILPESSSVESSAMPNPSVAVTGSETVVTENIEANVTGTSSPIILPNPAPSITEKVDGNIELSTILLQPELASLYSEKALDSIATEASSFTGVTNSTIAGVAIKTSVSVSLPLFNTKSDNGSTQQATNAESTKNTTTAEVPVNSEVEIIQTNKDSSLSTTEESSSDGLTLTTTSVETTTAGGFRIRKPKIKIPGSSDIHSTRAQRPFTPSLKRPSSTAGPPVSIFKKARTRIASITSSTTARPFRPFSPFSTIKIHYPSNIPGMVPGGELIVSTEPVTTTIATTTTTEEDFSEVPFTDSTYVPSVSSEDDVTLVKVAGYIVLERGIKWNEQLDNRHSPEYKEKAKLMHLHLERLFRSSSIAYRLWKIEIDGFSGIKKSRAVAVDFFLYLIKTQEEVSASQLVSVLHEKLSTNNTFGWFRVDPTRTTFEMLHEERMVKTTPPPEDMVEPPIPQWAIAVIVIGAASLIFIVLFAAVTMYGRHHMRRRYSSKLSEEDMDRSSGEWESKMAAAYENMAADTIYDAEDLQSDTYKKSYILD